MKGKGLVSREGFEELETNRNWRVNGGDWNGAEG